MRVQVDMPQLGESIVEGTIVEWHKKVGDQVQEDEPLFTITTDKVDTDVPAPHAGTLVEILAKEDDVVGVGQAVAVIETDASAAASASDAHDDAQKEEKEEPKAESESKKSAKADAVEETDDDDDEAQASDEDLDLDAVAISPVAKKMLEQAGVTSLDGIEGTGVRGRILKKDVEDYLQSRGSQEASAAATGSSIPPGARPTNVRERGRQFDSEQFKPVLAHPVAPNPTSSPTAASTEQIPAPPILTSSFAAVPSSSVTPVIAQPKRADVPTSGRVVQQRPNRPSQFNLPIVQTGQHTRPSVESMQASGDENAQPMSRSRVSIAKNLSAARRTAVNCSTVWDADVTELVAARKRLKGEFERAGVRLTYTPFFLSAIAGALQKHPELNAATDGDNIIYRPNINIGIASAWRDGMVVPKISHADTLSLLGLSRAVHDLRRRTKEGELKPADLGQATFTFTNSGIIGARYGVPTLFPGQVGIISVGTINKRVVVGENDSLCVRSMVELCLTFDHRVVDFNDADSFMKQVVETLQKADW